MGLSSRHQQGAVRLGGKQISKEKEGAPLRKIVATLRHGTDLFDRNYVELECGHTTSSNATYRARCADCKKAASAA